MKQFNTYRSFRPGLFLMACIFSVVPFSSPAQTAKREPNAHDLVQPENPALPTLFIIGDSTVRNGNGTGKNGEWGWGDFLAPYFDLSRINVVNNALGGTSTRTFYRDRWPGIKSMMKPGDFLILQFGHNDASPVNEEELNSKTRSRGTIDGAGSETESITNILTGKFEVVHSFGWYEKQFIVEARARGVQPMVCSLIPRNKWENDRTVRHAESYAGWAGEAAKSENVPFLNINEIIAQRYDQLGEEGVAPLFIPGAGPHTSKAGAELNAECVIFALKALPENPLAPFLFPKN